MNEFNLCPTVEIESYTMNWTTGKMTHWHHKDGTTVTQALPVKSANAFRDEYFKRERKQR